MHALFEMLYSRFNNNVATLGLVRSWCVMCWHRISLSVMPVLCACVVMFYLPISVGANCQVSWARGLGEQEGGGMHVEGFRVPCVCAGGTVCGVSWVRLLWQYSNQVVNNKCVINAFITIIIHVIYNALYIPSFQTMHWSESWVNKWVGLQRLFVVSRSTNATLAWKNPQKHHSNKTIEMSFMQESIYFHKFRN